MKKRLLSMFSAIALVLSLFTLLPEGALKAEAATNYALWIAGTQVTSANASDILGNGEASFNVSSKTLTLSKDIIVTDVAVNACISSEINGLIINAENDVTLKSYEQAIKTVGADLRVTGKGKITADVPMCGIYCHNAKVTVADANFETKNCKYGITGCHDSEELVIIHSAINAAGSEYAIGDFINGITLKGSEIETSGASIKKHNTTYYIHGSGYNSYITSVSIKALKEYDISLGGTQITFENCDNIFEGHRDYDGKARFDHATKTLYLNDVGGSGRMGFINKDCDGLTVCVEGECGFSASNGGAGALISANTTITGPGKIYFISTRSETSGIGISISGGATLTLNGADVIATGTKTGIRGSTRTKDGIVYYASLVVRSSVLNASGDDAGITGVEGGIKLVGSKYVTPVGAVIKDGTVYNSNGRTKADEVKIEKVITVTFSGTNAYIDQEPNPYKKLTSGDEVKVGSKVRLIYDSDVSIPTGKYVTSFTSNQVTIQKDGSGYYFIMPAKSVTVNPTYATQQSHVIDLSSGNAVKLSDNEAHSLYMLSEYTDKLSYIIDKGFDLDKNGTADVLHTYDSATNSESLVKLSTNSVNGVISFEIKNAPYSPLTFKMSNVTNYNLYIAGTQVTSQNCTDILGDGIFEYVPSTNTLTVKGDYTYNHAEHGYRTANVIKNGIKGLTIKTTKPLLLKNNTSNVIYTTEDINIRTNGLLTIEAYNIAVFTNPNESGAASNVTVTDSDIYVADSYYGFNKYSGNSYLYANNSNIKVITRARNSIDMKTSLTNCKLITLTDKEALIVRNTFSLYVAGTQVTSMNYADILGDGVFSYDPITNILDVNGNCTSILDNTIKNGINGLTVRINKDCTFAEGLYFAANTTVTGNGKLTINVRRGQLGFVITGSDHTLTFDNANIVINGGSNSIITEYGNTNSLIIINSSISAESNYGFTNNIFKQVTLTDCAMVTPSDGFVSTTGFYNSDGTSSPTKVEIVPKNVRRQVGDVNGDGKVSADDAIIVARYAANYSNYRFIYYYDYCDMNRDGNVTADDAIIIARYAANYGNYKDIYTNYVTEPDDLL